MPQTISLYKLFLASPSDVKEERLIVENVINDFNNTYSSQLNARIELCSWEKSSYPSVGEYPQAVINSQIGDEYDIFLGILWTRFGSKTLHITPIFYSSSYFSYNCGNKGNPRVCVYSIITNFHQCTR